MRKSEIAICNHTKFRQSIRTRGHKHDATSQASQMLDHGSKQVTNSCKVKVETVFRKRIICCPIVKKKKSEKVMEHRLL
jgi:predicted GNAT family acetyltransferase